MRNRHRVLSLLLSLLFLWVPVLGRGDEPGTLLFVLGMPKTFYVANQVKVQDVLLEVWQMPNTSANRSWVDSGWTEWVATNSGATVVVYSVTAEQILGTCSDTNIVQWRVYLSNSNVTGHRTRDFDGLMQEYGLVQQ